MAMRRMISLQVIDTDAFLDMTIASQCLYFHLNLHADDDGLIGSPKKIMREIGCKEDNLHELSDHGFIIQLQDGVVVIRHWKVNNLIRSDRYTPTLYQAQLSCLDIVDGVYNLATEGLPVGNQTGGKRDAQVKREEESGVKDRKVFGGKRMDSMQLLEQSISEFGFSETLTDSIREWLRYKQESGFKYKTVGLKNLLKEVSEETETHGEEAVCGIIQRSIASGWKGIAWEKIERERPERKKASEDGKTGIVLFK